MKNLLNILAIGIIANACGFSKDSSNSPTEADETAYDLVKDGGGYSFNLKNPASLGLTSSNSMGLVDAAVVASDDQQKDNDDDSGIDYPTEDRFMILCLDNGGGNNGDGNNGDGNNSGINEVDGNGDIDTGENPYPIPRSIIEFELKSSNGERDHRKYVFDCQGDAQVRINRIDSNQFYQFSARYHTNPAYFGMTEWFNGNSERVKLVMRRDKPTSRNVAVDMVFEKEPQPALATIDCQFSNKSFENGCQAFGLLNTPEPGPLPIPQTQMQLTNNIALQSPICRVGENGACHFPVLPGVYKIKSLCSDESRTIVVGAGTISIVNFKGCGEDDREREHPDSNADSLSQVKNTDQAELKHFEAESINDGLN